MDDVEVQQFILIDLASEFDAILKKLSLLSDDVKIDGEERPVVLDELDDLMGKVIQSEFSLTDVAIYANLVFKTGFVPERRVVKGLW